ncbi:bifunctional 2-keto-4-hydroxyglutarate aldolase/2-keto-3-deoxy-6-phosphogluconate aldolase [Halobacillus ihumii]|uniref:bifunctional 2-keto-4-hydroxyglutarate aldolase/2-keto-3-deoxy-6-phosphogluconate aldolase n=1 Tax=Halobacillus ihumii TaxID=2686092 RepID=UPI0013D782FD|nr:bifunctional 2-keto-4-hydroxyglutarate aldolase/2-keto-3-deoxy-6-phosphogluconate aldolase [Halobacillus ihumii]
MQAYTYLTQMIEQKLTVVVRGETAEEAIKAAEACIEGGVTSLEVTFTIPDAEKVLRYFAAHDDVMVGAGTVLDPETAKAAINAGAKFIVGPNYSRETAFLCNRYQIPYLPGCMTLNEMVQALETGASVVKLFPGQNYDPSFIKAVKGPLPYVEIMPTGGVNIDNMNDWLKAGAIMVGVGGEITRPAKTGDFSAVTANARAFVDKLKEVGL